MEEKSQTSPNIIVLPVVLFNLIVYIIIGLLSGVLTVFVHNTLGFSATVAGCVFALQYVATASGRPSAGRLTDNIGPKPIVIVGLTVCAISSILVTLAGVFTYIPYLSLALLCISRPFLGWAESWTATSVTVWNIEKVGAKNTSVAISWNGICSYGGMALGAPIGVQLSRFHHPFDGLVSIGLCACILIFSALGILFGFSWLGYYQAIKPEKEANTSGNLISFPRALNLVKAYGGGLACGAIGFAAISSLLPLYYAYHHWNNVGNALSAFGAVFVIVRFLFSSQIEKRGGAFVALISLAVETIGLGILTFFPSSLAATIGAAFTGAGFSLLFPALGVLAVNSVGPRNRGAALSAYSICVDLAIASSGVILGKIVQLTQSYTIMFATTMAFSLGGVIISQFLTKKHPRP
ncbi:MFS transporter [Swingsia samuiensis]|uniref:MFS transporter n=1 Tax=Swingsia samuiensis TaxID=1293412 RepID=A0A4Y6UKV9_9PROT|nr:MFS transporter [Swingsia samuiensis]QDH17031.1 MFS transporter [Swingsia samuiensis]